MPTYSYQCTECDDRFDIVQAFTDDALTTCNRCSGRLRKRFNSVGVVFKGSGFYRTDSRESAKKSSSSSNGSSSSDSGSSTSTSSEKSGSSEKQLRLERQVEQRLDSADGRRDQLTVIHTCLAGRVPQRRVAPTVAAWANHH